MRLLLALLLVLLAAAPASAQTPTIPLTVEIVGPGGLRVDGQVCEQTCTVQTYGHVQLSDVVNPSQWVKRRGWPATCLPPAESHLCNLRFTEPTTVTIHFDSTGNYWVWTQAGGSVLRPGDVGFGCSLCGGGGAAGESVTVSAVPYDGWRFARWEGDCLGTTPTCTFTIAGGKKQVVLAVFEPLPGTLTLEDLHRTAQLSAAPTTTYKILRAIGFPFRVRCGITPCRVKAQLRLPAKLAKRLRLPVVIASRTATLSLSPDMALRPSPKTLRTLGRRRVALRLRVDATVGGERKRVEQTVRLRP